MNLATLGLCGALVATSLLCASLGHAQECAQTVLDESSLATAAQRLASAEVDTGAGAAIATSAGLDTTDAKCLRQYALVAVKRWDEAKDWQSCASVWKKWNLPDIQPDEGWRPLTVEVGGNVTRLSIDVAADDAINDIVVYSAPSGFRAKTELHVSVPKTTKQLKYRIDCSDQDHVLPVAQDSNSVQLAQDFQPNTALQGETIFVNSRPVQNWPISLWDAKQNKYVASLEGKPKCERQLLDPGPFDFDEGCADEEQEVQPVGLALRLGPDFAWGNVFVTSSVGLVASLVVRPTANKFVAPFFELGLLSTGSRYGGLAGLGWVFPVLDGLDVVPVFEGEYVKVAVPTTESQFVAALQPRLLIRPHWDWFGLYGGIGYTATVSNVSDDLVQKGYVSLGAGIEGRWH